MNINFERLLTTYNEYPGKIKTKKKIKKLESLIHLLSATGKCSAVIDIRIILQKGQRHLWSTKSEPNPSV